MGCRPNIIFTPDVPPGNLLNATNITRRQTTLGKVLKKSSKIYIQIAPNGLAQSVCPIVFSIISHWLKQKIFAITGRWYTNPKQRPTKLQIQNKKTSNFFFKTKNASNFFNIFVLIKESQKLHQILKYQFFDHWSF